MRIHASTESDLRLTGLQLPEASDDAQGDACLPALSLCQTSTYRWSLIDDLVHYADAGIGVIGLYRPKVEEFEEDLAIDVIRSSNMIVSSLSWIGGFTGSDGSPQAESLYDAREAMRLAAAVDAGAVVLVTGGLGRHIPRQAHRLLRDALHELCDEAESLHLKLALHPFSHPSLASRTLIRSLNETLAVIKRMDRNSLGVMLDLHQLSAERGLVEALPEIAPLVHCVRVRGRRPRIRGRRLHLGERAAGAARPIRALLRAGYSGPIEFDLWCDHARAVGQYETLIRQCRTEFESFRSDLGT